MKPGSLALVIAIMAACVSLEGCVAGCGVGPATGDMNVDANGAVHFTSSVGRSESLKIPMADSADVDETIESASLTGAGASAFRVLTTFPLHVPAGTSVDVEVEFTPTAVGSATATLVLQTAAMGPSPVALEGDAS